MAASKPSLAARRKTETRLEIAHTAARLFAEQGTAAVTAEQIAAEAGVGLRTFYRYCRTKEDAVEPMLSTGASRWLDALAAGPRRLPTRAELEHAAVRALTPDAEIGEELDIMRGLLRAMAGDPALHTVWQRVNSSGEQALLTTLTDLSPDSDPLRLRLLAAAAATAIRIALEQWATTDAPATGAGSPADLVATCMHDLTGNIR
ncbi:TetR/AcrR family transcriptional regulator [Nocardia mexicana]|uniref:TetR family transcriptional regulator n=1 Tax=Nocardia mexicana TaxID=279262 RepID=A0A370GRI5_9NOCA|nr:TetR/AcrR family transcriptional regulator [Nocardia mexicana]RDI46328.1 TetR family transcriptional regulator [Nocardia mexicana]